MDAPYFSFRELRWTAALLSCGMVWNAVELAAAEPGAVLYVNGQWIRSGPAAAAPPDARQARAGSSRTAAATAVGSAASTNKAVLRGESGRGTDGNSGELGASADDVVPPVVTESLASFERPGAFVDAEAKTLLVSHTQADEDCAAKCACPEEVVECCGCLPPCCWTAWADVMFLQRSNGPGLGLVFADGFLGVPGNPGPEIVNARDLSSRFQAAPRFGISRCLCDCYSVDANVFWIDNLTDSTSFVTPFHVSFPGFVQAFLPPPAGVGTFVLGTDLFSAEANLRRDTNDWLTLLAGFRWMELHDRLEFQFQPNGGANRGLYTIDANNHLYGFQIGALGDLWNNGDRWRLNFWAKAGVYYNAADQGTNVFFPAVGSTADRDDVGAFAGDIGITAVRQLTDRLALRLGYQFLWIDGVALAPNQLLGTNDVTVPISILDTNGSISFNGAFVGLEAAW